MRNEVVVKGVDVVFFGGVPVASAISQVHAASQGGRGMVRQASAGMVVDAASNGGGCSIM